MGSAANCSRCPCPWKQRWEQRVTAETRARMYSHIYKSEQRAYLCRCGFWHLTSKPLREDEEW